MSILVVDASVVLKWFLPEVHSDAARDLLQEAHQFVVPDLLFPEAGNAIWKKVRRGELSSDEAHRLVADIEAAAVESIPTRGLIGDASAIAFASAQTVYDCVYLALAVRLETRVITADERFERAIRSNPVLPNTSAWLAHLHRKPVLSSRFSSDIGKEPELEWRACQQTTCAKRSLPISRCE